MPSVSLKLYTKFAMKKDLLSIIDLTQDELRKLVEFALQIKREGGGPVLAGKTLALIFEKPSLRTRVSFDVAMYQLGGHALYLSGEEVGLGKREAIKDMAGVLSRYVDMIVARTFAHRTVEELAQHASIPVINGLSDREHPCQIVADLLTIYEKKGKLDGLTVAFIGDGNNVANSLILATAMLGMHFAMASPHGYWIQDKVVSLATGFARENQSQIFMTSEPEEVVGEADVIYTDVWVSMGQEAEKERRLKDFARYRIDAQLLAKARPEAILMHPMPVHWGEELAKELVDSPRLVLLDQAENRLHAQKAILAKLGGNTNRSSTQGKPR